MDEVKRVRYFKHEFLDAEDFNDEQNYHCQMRHMHNRDFHTWGIGHGLEVSFTEGQEKGTETKVTVSPGTAVDGEGREIVLAISKTIDFTGYEAGKSYYVTVKWQEQPGLPSQQDELKRWEEVPYIDIDEGYPEEPEITLVLTKVTLKEKKIIAAIDHSDRRYATLEVGDDTVSSAKIVKADGTSGQDTTLGEGIKTAHIQDLAVTGAKIAENTINESKFDSATRKKLVTNGNNHDHAGGDGAQIKHSSLNKDDGRNPHGTTAADVAALPAAGGTVNGNVAVNGSLQSKVLNFYGTGSDSGVSPQHYAIYQESGPQVPPYPDLVIAYHTGIKIGGHKNYEGTRFYNDAPQGNGATEIMSVGKGDNNTRVNYSLLVSGNGGIGKPEPKTELEVNGYITKKEVAFSAYGTGHTSEGKAKLMQYQTTITNEGASWTGSRFTAPVEGLYFFTVSFVKDAFSNGGTEDDVYVAIWLNGVSKGAGMSGEGTGKRGTGTCSLVLKMNKGDRVETYASSDGEKKRHFDHCYFTGFKL